MIDGYDRGRLFNLTLLASVLADQRKVEEACETGVAALRIAFDVRLLMQQTRCRYLMVAATHQPSLPKAVIRQHNSPWLRPPINY